ncbi:MAG TPA: aminoacyl-tRNA hydrolase [Candidatus Saccharimonadia bacterium]|nr:aminoacyl-tRNA hydrolase [Candidatus Saccharimonadia bacterium]
MAKKYVIGLGNPGSEYAKSRHNAGFMVVDGLAEKLGLSWKFEKKFDAEVARAAGGDVVLVKPQTFMNDSGKSVRAVLAYDKYPGLETSNLTDVFIAYDDLDILLGQKKIQFATHPKIHNGVNSILQTLGTDQFWNVRIGTDTRDGSRTIDSKEYVLKPLTAEERARLAEVIANVIQEVHASITAA